MGTPRKLLNRMRKGADSRFVITTNSTSPTYQQTQVIGQSMTWYVTGDIDPIPAPQVGINPVFNLSGNTGLVRVIATTSDQLTRVSRIFVKDTVSVDITECPAMNRFEIESGFLTTIDVSNNPVIDRLKVSRNSIASIDLSNTTSLTILEVDYNQLTSSFLVNLPLLVNLTALVCNSNSIGNIDIGVRPTLTNVNMSSNGMSGAFSFPNNSILTRLLIGTNQSITSIDVTNLVSLNYFDFAWVNIGPGNIDLTNNTAMIYLKFNLNFFTEGITISQMPNINFLQCNDNGMTTTGTDFMWNQLSTIATNANTNGGTFIIKNNRTAASDAAFTNLVTNRGWIVTQTVA
jgi:Leucine-rich repeat (LRR) protein